MKRDDIDDGIRALTKAADFWGVLLVIAIVIAAIGNKNQFIAPMFGY